MHYFWYVDVVHDCNMLSHRTVHKSCGQRPVGSQLVVLLVTPFADGGGGGCCVLESRFTCE